MDTTFIIVVLGPTASGKTKLAIDLALEFGGEIISADSMQVYKNLDIATAKPTEEEKKGIPHHLMGFLEQEQSFSVTEFVKQAKITINDIKSRGKIPIIAGGTGLYINSLINNIKFDNMVNDYEYRNKLREFAKQNGNKALHDLLAEVDPEIALKLHENNLSRVIRALEVHKITRKTMTSLQKESREEPSDYDSLIFGINFSLRENLYERINKRVDIMMENGLLQEAETFLEQNLTGTSVQAIGYKELKPFFKNELSLCECVENLKKETRNYAKRQLTWFKKDERINWLEIGVLGSYEDEYKEILNKAKKIVKSYGNYFKNMV